MNIEHDTTGHSVNRVEKLDTTLFRKPSFLKFQRQLESDLEKLVDRWSSSAAPLAARTSVKFLR